MSLLPEKLRRRLQAPAARQAGWFFASRAVNGVLALLQVVLVTKAIGTAEGGRFFLLWTAAWLLAAILRFGTDGILPRGVAEAAVGGLGLISVRRVLSTALLVGLLALPVMLLALGVGLSPAAIGLTLGLALTCAGTWIIAALLRSHGRADLAGLTANVLWPLGSTLAPVPLLATGGSWQGLGAITLLTWVIALAASLVVAARALGAAPLRALVSRTEEQVPVERDEVGAATLTSLYELLQWLPVVLTALLGVGPAAAASVFAATRIAGPFSWPYQSVTAVLVPRVARGFAARDHALLRRTLIRGGVAGALVTWPFCAAGMLLARPLLSLLNPAYVGATSVLVLLIAARAVDAATGPVGEALLVGRRTWLDVRIVVAGIGAGTAAAFALHHTSGVLAVGLGVAGAFVAINLLRALTLGRLLAVDITPGTRRPAPSDSAGDATPAGGLS